MLYTSHFMNNRVEQNSGSVFIRNGKDGGAPYFVSDRNATPMVSALYEAILTHGGTNKHVSIVNLAIQPLLRLSREVSCFTQSENLFAYSEQVLEALSEPQKRRLSSHGAIRMTLAPPVWKRIVSEVRPDAPNSYSTSLFVVTPRLWENIDVKHLHLTIPYQFFAYQTRLGLAEPIELAGLPNALTSMYQREFARFADEYGSRVPRPAARTVMMATVKSMAMASHA